jgi:agmatine deiminase
MMKNASSPVAECGGADLGEDGETPARLGYRMPAEWEPHAATWLTWPHNAETWPGRLDRVPPVWVRMVEALSPGEAVHVLVNDGAVAKEVRRLLENSGASLANVFLHEVVTNDAWTRDHGPTFLTRNVGDRMELAMVDWIFNAWGGKYPPWEDDDAVPGRIAELLGVPRFEPGIVMEGGAIDVNGAGTVLTTESCLLKPNRNPHLGRDDVERFLREYLGVRQVLWLAGGMAGDDTDGHIDNITRFVDSNTVVAAGEDDPADENYRPLQENVARLHEMRDQDGRPLRIVPLPMPDAVFCEGQRLPASYANFYIGNEVVLVPTFGQRKDMRVIEIVQSLFPGRRVVGIESTDLLLGFGAIHCVTQQQPQSGLRSGF